MRRLAPIYCSFSIGLSVLLWGVIGYAAEFDLEINAGASYDTNVFRASDVSAKDDAYLTLAPKALLKLPMSKTYSSFGIRGVMEQHVGETSADLQEVVFSGLGRYSPLDHVSFGMKDEVIISGRLKSAEELSDATRKREFADNRFTAAFKYDFKGGKLATSLEYANIIRNYWNTQMDDWKANSGQLQVEHFLGHKTSTSLGIGLTRKVYEANVNYISVPVFASLKRDLSSKVEAVLSMGMERRRYNEALGELDWNEMTASLDITGEFTSKTKSRLLLQRASYDSDAITGYAFISTAADFSMALELNDFLRLTIEALYSRNNYVQIEREDDLFVGRVQIRHSFSSRGSVDLGYRHEQRRSSISKNDYQQHAIEIYYLALF